MPSGYAEGRGAGCAEGNEGREGADETKGAQGTARPPYDIHGPGRRAPAGGCGTDSRGKGDRGTSLWWPPVSPESRPAHGSTEGTPAAGLVVGGGKNLRLGQRGTNGRGDPSGSRAAAIPISATKEREGDQRACQAARKQNKVGGGNDREAWRGGWVLAKCALL